MKEKPIGWKKIDGITFEIYKKKKEIIMRARLPKSSKKTSDDLLSVMDYESNELNR